MAAVYISSLILAMSVYFGVALSGGSVSVALAFGLAAGVAPTAIATANKHFNK